MGYSFLEPRASSLHTHVATPGYVSEQEYGSVQGCTQGGVVEGIPRGVYLPTMVGRYIARYTPPRVHREAYSQVYTT